MKIRTQLCQLCCFGSRKKRRRKQSTFASVGGCNCSSWRCNCHGAEVSGASASHSEWSRVHRGVAGAGRARWMPARRASSEHATVTSDDDDDDDDDSSSPVGVLLATCVHARCPPETEVFPPLHRSGDASVSAHCCSVPYVRLRVPYRRSPESSSFASYRYDARIVSSRGLCAREFVTAVTSGRVNGRRCDELVRHAASTLR